MYQSKGNSRDKAKKSDSNHDIKKGQGEKAASEFADLRSKALDNNASQLKITNNNDLPSTLDSHTDKQNTIQKQGIMGEPSDVTRLIGSHLHGQDYLALASTSKDIRDKLTDNRAGGMYDNAREQAEDEKPQKLADEARKKTTYAKAAIEWINAQPTTLAIKKKARSLYFKRN